MSESPKEHEILMVMRKVLATIIKDTTPPPGMQSPLRPSTVEDIRNCLMLIATREHELAQARGIHKEQPFFVDEKPDTEVVSIDKIQHPKKSTIN